MPLNYRHTIPTPETAASTPLDNPLGGPRPRHFLDGELLTIQYRTDPDAIAALVPAPLTPVGDTVAVQIARWGDVPGSGRDTFEMNVMVSVEYAQNGTQIIAGYSPYFYVTSDRFMASGREFHGQPKLMADVSLEVRGDLIVGTVTRNGIEVFSGTLPYKARQSSLAELRSRVDPISNINLKIIPQIDGSPGIRQLTCRELANLHLSGCWVGPGTAEIRPNAQAPLYRLPVLEHLEGFYWTADFDLVGGRIIHVYGEDNRDSVTEVQT